MNSFFSVRILEDFKKLRILFLAIPVILFGCDSEKGLDCFQAAGDIVQEERMMDSFSEITVFERTKLIVQQGDVQKVLVESGANLLNDIDVKVKDGVLLINNNNSCNLVRDYGITKVIVTSPNITTIRSSTGYLVESLGVLRYPSLRLLSEDQANEDEFHSDGDFRLDLDVEYLEIVANGLSNFMLSGSATQAKFGLYAGDCRVRAENLIIQNLEIYHRSTGDMHVNPQQSIIGKIVSLGDVKAKTKPAIVEVEQPYKGRLIFEQ